VSDNFTYTTIAETEFHDLLLSKSHVPLLVVFTANWLGEGTIMDTIVENIAGRYHDKIGCYRIDIEASKGLTHLFGIRRLPAMFIFRNGEIVDHFSGMTPKRTLEERLNQLL